MFLLEKFKVSSCFPGMFINFFLFSVIYVESADGYGFRSERKAKVNQMEEDRRNAASPVDMERDKTTAEFAVVSSTVITA